MTKSDYLEYGPWPTEETMLVRLKESASITLKIMHSLKKGQEEVVLSSIVNPPLWEFGHLIWFHEFWVHRRGIVSNPSFLKHADTLFNSSQIHHDERWQVKLPSLALLQNYFADVFDQTYAVLKSGSVSPEQAYYILLALHHQDMHNEAFAYMWQSLAYPWPIGRKREVHSSQADHSQRAYIDMPATKILLGSPKNSGFIFDNEKWQHEVSIPAFSIASHAVSNIQYVRFLD